MDDNKQIFVSSNKKNTYPIFLTQEELEAIPVLLGMAETYLWELYDKKEDDSYYVAHKANIDAIEEYHKGRQGVMAVGYNIVGKAKALLNDVELRNVLDEYMNKGKVL